VRFDLCHSYNCLGAYKPFGQKLGFECYARGMKTDVTLEEAVSILAGILPTPRRESVSLLEGLHRVLAEDLKSLVDHPSCDDSSLDGYAVRLEDTLQATPDLPVRLEVMGAVAAGSQPFVGRLEKDQAVKVFTGAPVPDGTTGIVMVENTARDEDSVFVYCPATDDVRKRGQDLEVGKSYLQKGQILRGSQIALAAAMGHSNLPVYKVPRIAILSTGDEILEPGQPLPPGGAYNANSYGLAAMLREMGAEPVILPRVKDDLDSIRQSFEAAKDCDLLLTIGGVSMGDRDFVRMLLEREANIHYWKIKVKPGGPPVCATWQDLPVFGLPGNPVSSLVIFLLVVKPALYQRYGVLEPAYETVTATALTPFKSAGAKTGMWRCTLEKLGNGFGAKAFGNQSSGVLRSMVQANALAVVPPQTEVKTGDTLEVIRL
jgi:molybdopterin molybdotransferase